MGLVGFRFQSAGSTPTRLQRGGEPVWVYISVRSVFFFGAGSLYQPARITGCFYCPSPVVELVRGMIFIVFLNNMSTLSCLKKSGGAVSDSLFLCRGTFSRGPRFSRCLAGLVCSLGTERGFRFFEQEGGRSFPLLVSSWAGLSGFGRLGTNHDGLVRGVGQPQASTVCVHAPF